VHCEEDPELFSEAEWCAGDYSCYLVQENDYREMDNGEEETCGEMYRKGPPPTVAIEAIAFG
jgi:hypothetical protein